MYAPGLRSLTGRRHLRRAAQVLQAQLTRIGIELQLEVLDWPAYIKRQRCRWAAAGTG